MAPSESSNAVAPLEAGTINGKPKKFQMKDLLSCFDGKDFLCVCLWLTGLYVVLSFYYWALLEAALAARGTNYMALKSDYFGDFNTHEVYDLPIANRDKPLQLRGRDGYNLPKSCAPESLDGQELVVCKNKKTSIFPWQLDLFKTLPENTTSLVSGCTLAPAKDGRTVLPVPDEFIRIYKPTTFCTNGLTAAIISKL